jgi:hypothetical protein
MLLRIADNAFTESRSGFSKEDQGEDALYHLHIFHEYAEGWVDHRLDRGPFVLVHGDLEPFNFIVNEKMEIISALDWEWSRVVPLRFFKPPLWLRIPDTTKLAYNFVYNNHLKSFNQLLEIVQTREREKYGNGLWRMNGQRQRIIADFLLAMP